MSSLHHSKVIIIGAGLSGLATARALKARGIDALILEAGDQIAGPWRRRHPQLRLNIHRRFARLPGLWPPRGDGVFLRRDSVVRYLEDYAARADLRIALGTRVAAVQRLGTGWRVCTDRGDYTCAHLVVATGRENRPHIPDWPGAAAFRGDLRHAADLGDIDQYRGRNVLVIGAGNSGTDVLNHLSGIDTGRVWVSVRHGPTIVPTRLAGVVLHRLAQLFALMPRRVLDPAFALTQWLAFGNLARYGLGRHRDGGATRLLRDGTTFAVDDGFVAALKARRFQVVAETVGFGAVHVDLADGRKLCPDVVICATGYQSGLEPLLGHLGVLDRRGYPSHPLGQADPDNPGLWFVGFKPVFTGYFHSAGVTARRIAAAIARPPRRAAVSPSGPPVGPNIAPGE